MHIASGRRIFAVIGAIFGILGVAAIALDVYLHVRFSDPTDTLRNVYGFYIPWSAAAGFLIVVPILLLGLWALRWWQLWRRSRQEGVPMATIVRELKRNQ